MTQFIAEQVEVTGIADPAISDIYQSLLRLFEWLERNAYCGYDTFDGLSARFLRSLTFENHLLLVSLQQAVRRFPINLRPLLGIERNRSSKGMGFIARGFIRLSEATGDPMWADRAKSCLHWLMHQQSPGYSGACWGNHFDYVSRNGSIPKGMPTVVWTSLIGHAFLDAYIQFGNDEYLRVAISICEHIMRDLATCHDGSSLCISYTPGNASWVHNANTLGGCFLARTYAHTKKEEYLVRAEKAMAYTARYQRPDGSWFYGEKQNLHWVDNFHTAYVLDCFKHYSDSAGCAEFDPVLWKGYEFWKQNFFLADGTPKYYVSKLLPLDIQCSSQAIDTLVFFSDRDPDALPLALKVARWTINHMQDSAGYFYYRRYSRMLVNKTPTLHWGQATMLCALAGLYKALLGASAGRARGFHSA